MKNASATDKDIRLRKWCMECAMKATGISATAEWMVGQAQQLYDWITAGSSNDCITVVVVDLIPPKEQGKKP